MKYGDYARDYNSHYSEDSDVCVVAHVLNAEGDVYGPVCAYSTSDGRYWLVDVTGTYEVERFVNVRNVRWSETRGWIYKNGRGIRWKE